MDLSSYRVGHACGRCGSLYPQDQQPCLRCGAAQVNPLYDFYQMLGVTPGAGENDIKTAYKKLSLKYHPDVNPEGKDLFLLISEAYATLKDPGRRETYTRLLAQARQGAWTRERPRVETFEEQVFEGSPFGYRRVDPAEYEKMYREFHKVHRMSQISSRMGAMLGALMGLGLGLVSGGSLGTVLVGLIIGFFFGRVNPGLAPLLVRFMNLAMLAILGVVIYLSVHFRAYPAIPLLLIFAWFFFSATRRWGRELNGFRKA